MRPSRKGLIPVSGLLVFALLGCADSDQETESMPTAEATSEISETPGDNSFFVDRLETSCFSDHTAFSPNRYYITLNKVEIFSAGGKAVVWQSLFANDPIAMFGTGGAEAVTASCIEILDFETGEVFPVLLPEEYAGPGDPLSIEAVGIDPSTNVLHVAGRLLGSNLYEARSPRDGISMPLVHLEYDLRSSQWQQSPLSSKFPADEVFFAHIAGSPGVSGGIIVQKSQYGVRGKSEWSENNVAIRFDVVDGVSQEVARVPIPLSIENPTKLVVSEDLTEAFLFTGDYDRETDRYTLRAVRVNFANESATEFPIELPEGRADVVVPSRDFSELYVHATTQNSLLSEDAFQAWATQAHADGTWTVEGFIEKASEIVQESELVSLGLSADDDGWKIPASPLATGDGGFSGQPMIGATGGGLWTLSLVGDGENIDLQNRGPEEIRTVEARSTDGRITASAPLCDRLYGGTLVDWPEFGEQEFYSELDRPVGVFDIGRTDAVLVACLTEEWANGYYQPTGLYLAMRFPN